MRKLAYWLLLPFYVLKSKAVSRADKAKVYGALGYFVLPFDIVPDYVPIAGLSDDLAILIWAIYTVWKNITPEIKDQAQEKARKFFLFFVFWHTLCNNNGKVSLVVNNRVMGKLRLPKFSEAVVSL